jgi:hypothetical protein
MELSGPDGDKLELMLVGYQFPCSSKDEWDANWLIIRTRATIAGREWSSDDPAMLTGEVEELANWIKSLGNNREVEPLLDFVEPNLSFRLQDRSLERVRLQVLLELESRPPWKDWSPPRGAPEGPVLDCSAEDMLAWSTNLKDQLQKFPRRNPL